MSQFDRYTVVRTFLSCDLESNPWKTPVVWVLDKATGQALASIKTLAPVLHFSEQKPYDYRAFLINGHQLNFSVLGKDALFDEITLSDAIHAITNIDLLEHLRETLTCQMVLNDQGERYLVVNDGYSYGLSRSTSAGLLHHTFKVSKAERLLQKLASEEPSITSLRIPEDQLFEPFDLKRIEIVYNNPAIKILLDERAS